jgi:chromate transporter
MHCNVQELGRIFFRVGSLSFGGGNANIAALRHELVEQRKWLTPAQFNLCYALARVVPGTNLLAFCVAVGWVLLGRAGALVAVLSLSLPSALIVVTLTSIYERYGQRAMILSLTRWLLAATIGVIAASAWALIWPSLKGGRWFRSTFIALGAFVLNAFLSVSPLKALLAAALIGIFWPEPEEK